MATKLLMAIEHVSGGIGLPGHDCGTHSTVSPLYQGIIDVDNS